MVFIMIKKYGPDPIPMYYEVNFPLLKVERNKTNRKIKHSSKIELITKLHQNEQTLTWTKC